MFEIVFYRDKDGKSEIAELLDELKLKSETDKSARINREKIMTYIEALTRYGTRMGKPFVKHIEGDLWELRPLRNRIFFFYWRDNKFIFVHWFIKKTQKTPKREIELAKNKMKDFVERTGGYEGYKRN